MAKGSSSIVEGALQATEYARIQRAVFDWICEDVGMAAKMTITPDVATKLVDRIYESRTTLKEQPDG